MQRISLPAAAAIALGSLALAGLSGCGSDSTTTTVSEPNAGAIAAPSTPGAASTLVIRANGEDFVRQGLTSKDGWEITFDHVYVSLADIIAAQTAPPFEPKISVELTAQAEVKVEGNQVVDLAEGDDTAEPIVIAELAAPAGHFNALAWRMVPAEAGPTAGYTLWLQGTATKDSETVPFTIKIKEELAFTCGDFVGEDRKGILAPGGTADLEASFHFDHLFGDISTPADDKINKGALGFGPLMALAQNGVVDVDSSALQAGLSATDYTTFLAILPSLGHVGEGHCAEVKLTTR